MTVSTAGPSPPLSPLRPHGEGTNSSGQGVATPSSSVSITRSPGAALDGRKTGVSAAMAGVPAARCDLSRWALAQGFRPSINLPSSAAYTTAGQP